MDGYCADHKHLSPEFNATQVDSQTAALLKSAEGNADATENLVHGLKAIALREEMMARAETYDVEISVDSIHDAKAALKGVQQTVDDVELGQIYYQFKRLDVDADGFFTVTDFNTWIYRVDPDFKTEEGTVEQWLRRETVDGSDQFDFINYYHMLMARRDFENNNWGHPLDVVVPMELKQTPFWDLRMIVLHALLNQDRCGWMLKRGYLFTKESMNSWKLRYMRTNTQRPYEPPTLEYWDADPNIDPSTVTEGQTMPQMKGSLPLRDIVLVDFSPKTPSPKGTDTALLAAMGKVGMTSEAETVMKITLVNGRRYTFACEQDKAVTWAAELSRHAAASRMMLDWRENWGTKRIGAVTLRDWLNAAIVIAKIGKSPQILEDAKKIIAAANNKFTVLPGSKAAAVTAANQQALQFVKDAVLNEREVMFLRVVGINEVNLDKMTGVVLLGVKALVLAQNKLKEYDTAMCHGIGQKVVQGAQDAVNVYMYAAAAKNAYNTSKFKVEWQSKNQERACGVCHQVFKSMTLRKTHGKHHCRACGKVVCHVCSANRIFMTVSNKFERVCTKCLTDNTNREVREIDVSNNLLLTSYVLYNNSLVWDLLTILYHIHFIYVD